MAMPICARNPVLSLTSAADVKLLSPAALAALATVLSELGCQARSNASKSWRTNKGPMATYGKTVAALARSTRRAILALSPGLPSRSVNLPMPVTQACAVTSHVPRSSRPETRNPVLTFQGVAQLQALSLEDRKALAAVLARVAEEARDRARASWRRWRFGERDLASIWKAISVYAGHIRRAMGSLAARRPVAQRRSR